MSFPVLFIAIVSALVTPVNQEKYQPSLTSIAPGVELKLLDKVYLSNNPRGGTHITYDGDGTFVIYDSSQSKVMYFSISHNTITLEKQETLDVSLDKIFGIRKISKSYCLITKNYLYKIESGSIKKYLNLFNIVDLAFFNSKILALRSGDTSTNYMLSWVDENFDILQSYSLPRFGNHNGDAKSQPIYYKNARLSIVAGNLYIHSRITSEFIKLDLSLESDKRAKLRIPSINRYLDLNLKNVNNSLNDKSTVYYYHIATLSHSGKYLMFILNTGDRASFMIVTDNGVVSENFYYHRSTSGTFSMEGFIHKNLIVSLDVDRGDFYLSLYKPDKP